MSNGFEKVKDIGKHIIGRGREVRFKNQVETMIGNTGYTRETIQTDLFNRLLQDLSAELAVSTNPDVNSDNWRNIEAAMNVIFNSGQIRNFIDNSVNTAIFRNLPIRNPGRGEVGEIRNYFQNRHQGQFPENMILVDIGRNLNEIQDLITRLNVDFTAYDVSTMPDEVGADIGRILELRRLDSRHERGFVSAINFRREMRASGDLILDSGANLLFRNIYNFGKEYAKHFQPTLKNFGPQFMAVSRLLGRTTRDAGRLAFGLGRAAFAGGRRLVER